MRAVPLILLASTLVGSPGAAQSGGELGDRVRVRHGKRQVVIGTLDSVTADSIRVRGAGQPLAIAISRRDITAMERSLGRQRQFGKSFGITLVSVSLGFATLAAASWEPCVPRDPFGLNCMYAGETRSEGFMMGLAAGAILGVPIGAMVGLGRRPEKWVPMTLPGTNAGTIAFAPIVGRRLGIAGSIRFPGS